MSAQNRRTEMDMDLEEIIKKRKGEGVRFRNFRRRGRFDRQRPYNAQKIYNKKINPSKDNRRRIKVTNLNKELNNSGLKELFHPLGTLTRCGIHFDKLGISTGKADIEYSTHEEAQKAIDNLNGADINGEKITVKYAPSRFRNINRDQRRVKIRRRYLRDMRRSTGGNNRLKMRRRGVMRLRRRKVGGETLGAQRSGKMPRRRIVFRSIGRRRQRKE